MAWDATFRDRLRTGTLPVGLALEVVRPKNGEGVGIEGWLAASDPGLGADATLLLSRPPRLGSSGVTPQSWSYQEGAWSVTLHVPDGMTTLPGGNSTGRPRMQYAARALKRGALLRLLIGEQGQPLSSYEPLKLGRLQSVRASAPGVLEVTAWDLMTALRTRFAATGASADERAVLFYGSAGQTDTVAVKYITGAGTLQITGATADRFLLETGGSGAVKVTGNTTTFYLTYTGTGVSTMTGLSGAGQFGTTASDANIGNTVTSTALLEGHPLDILRAILTSTGAGTNGPQDVYPRSWGLGIPDELLDDAAWGAAKARIQPASGSISWRIIVESEVDDPALWIAQIWGPAGIWLAVREGQIVPCYARDPNGTITAADTVTAADLDAARPPHVDWYPDAVPEVYHRSAITDAATTTSNTSNVNALPARETITHDTSASTVSISNAGAVRTEASDRLAPWDHFVPEYAVLPLVGVRSHAPGDVVMVSLPELIGRLDGTVEGYSQRPCMVVSESMDLASNTTQLTVAALPIDYNEDAP